jgi:hypothetical protein
MTEAFDQMIVDHADCLHECVANCAADEVEPVAFQVFAHRVGFDSFGRNILE